MIFFELAKYFEDLENNSSRLKMTEILAELFRKCDDEEIDEICYLVSGRLTPLYEAVEFGIADKFMMRAIAKATGADLDLVLKEFKKSGDLGETVYNIKFQIPNSKFQKLNVNEVFDKLKQIALTSGLGSQEKKIDMLSEILESAEPLSAKYLARIPLDKLRLGFSEMTILDALSWMIAGDKSLRSKFEDAYNVRPDIGFIAKNVKKYGTDGLKNVKSLVGTPILPALCQRLPNAEEMIKKMGMVDVEPKYDGVRCQIHFQITNSKSQTPNKSNKLSKVKSFSRNLESTTDMFPELYDIAKQIKADSVILDSEAVGFDPKTGKILPFQETSTRKRKYDIGLFSSQVPIRFYVFDILFKDGLQLLDNPLSKRRKILEQTVREGTVLQISPNIVTDDFRNLRQYHDLQIKLGLEGVVVKKWESGYEPGRRGFNWVKFKEEGQTGKLTDTIDAVVMGYYTGEGKRAGFGIGAFLVGIRNGESFVSISKVGTGVTDEKWHEFLKVFTDIKANSKPKEYQDVDKALMPDVWVSPKVVVEIAGDDLTISPNHGALYAIRFPRLVRVRKDKSPHEVTTLTEVAKLYKNQLSLNKI
jgi:DNA ligase 1